MSNTGKTSTYIRKTSVQESTILNTGFKKTRFLHQAALNDTLIQLTSLTTPTGAVGYSAPNVSELSQTNLMQWTQNFSLYSSISGRLIQNLSYVINGASTIKLLYSARDGEIFEGIIDHNARTGLTMVDAAPLVVSGTLLAGETDFNVGQPFKVGVYPSAKRGVVQVEIDGQPVYRTDGNAAFGAGISGDYYEVHSGGGLGQILRFNADLTNDRFIMVTSVGALVEKPNGSIMAALETVQGQIDAMVPTLAELAEVAESNFQSAPNNTDLKSFGDRVLSLEMSTDSRLDALEVSPPFSQAVLSADTSTTLADTYTDVTGASLSLSPGTYDIGFEGVWTQLRTTAAVTSNIVITDSSNNIIGNANRIVTNDTLANGQAHGGPISMTARNVVVTATTTYKVRIRNSGATAASTFTINGTGSYSASLTNPDNASIMWARRVGI